MGENGIENLREYLGVSNPQESVRMLSFSNVSIFGLFFLASILNLLIAAMSPNFLSFANLQLRSTTSIEVLPYQPTSWQQNA